jgi:hypothetical protein
MDVPANRASFDDELREAYNMVRNNWSKPVPAMILVLALQGLLSCARAGHCAVGVCTSLLAKFVVLCLDMLVPHRPARIFCARSSVLYWRGDEYSYSRSAL